jgi:uncharacterized protein YndB with AHSA1/START domain
MDFSLITEWRIVAPIERVWETLSAVDEWPRWWRFVRAVHHVAAGDANGVGARRRTVWASRLPYDLVFDMRTTVVERPTLLVATACGDLHGTGCWMLATDRALTRVRYTWRVHTVGGWIHRFAPLLAPIFCWNHNAVMAAGGAGLAREMGAAFTGMEILRGQ